MSRHANYFSNLISLIRVVKIEATISSKMCLKTFLLIILLSETVFHRCVMSDVQTFQSTIFDRKPNITKRQSNSVKVNVRALFVLYLHFMRPITQTLSHTQTHTHTNKPRKHTHTHLHTLSLSHLTHIHPHISQ